jgi:DNA polymerase elongation subunit (family B)
MLREIVTYWNKYKSKISKMDRSSKKNLFKRLVLTAFEFDNIENISKVYTKKSITKSRLSIILDDLLSIKENGEPRYPLGLLLKKNNKATEKEKRLDEEDEEEEIIARKKKWHPVGPQIIFKKDILFCLSYDFDSGDKLGILDRAIEYNPKEKLIKGFLPELEGDKCTFIGSTFLKVGQTEPYLNHCVVLDTCDNTVDVPNSVIESYETEEDMLLGWRNIIQKEDPDIIIGYNIFGFDYLFMHTRAEELKCEEQFMMLSRNKNDKCRLMEKQN